MVAICRQSIDYYLRGSGRRHAVGGDRVTRDALFRSVAFFRVERAFIKADSRAAAVMLRDIGPEPSDYVCLAIIVGITQRDDKSAWVRGTLVVGAAPGVDVDVAVRVDRDVSHVTEGVGEDDGAETGGQCNATIVTAACSVAGCGRRCCLSCVSRPITLAFAAGDKRQQCETADPTKDLHLIALERG